MIRSLVCILSPLLAPTGGHPHAKKTPPAPSDAISLCKKYAYETCCLHCINEGEIAYFEVRNPPYHCSGITANATNANRTAW